MTNPSNLVHVGYQGRRLSHGEDPGWTVWRTIEKQDEHFWLTILAKDRDHEIRKIYVKEDD